MRKKGSNCNRSRKCNKRSKALRSFIKKREKDLHPNVAQNHDASDENVTLSETAEDALDKLSNCERYEVTSTPVSEALLSTFVSKSEIIVEENRSSFFSIATPLSPVKRSALDKNSVINKVIQFTPKSRFRDGYENTPTQISKNMQPPLSESLLRSTPVTRSEIIVEENRSFFSIATPLSPVNRSALDKNSVINKVIQFTPKSSDEYENTPTQISENMHPPLSESLLQSTPVTSFDILSTSLEPTFLEVENISSMPKKYDEELHCRKNFTVYENES